MDYTRVKKGKGLLIPLEFYVYNGGISLDKPSAEPFLYLTRCQFTHYLLLFEASIHLASSNARRNIGVISFPDMNGPNQETCRPRLKR